MNDVSATVIVTVIPPKGGIQNKSHQQKMNTASHESYMKEALRLAEEAAANGEVPVGAVLVQEGRIIGRGANAPIGSHDPTAHAEILALREAARAVGNYRLPGSVLYVTIEPCTMCVGALIHARVSTLVFGAREPRAGAVVSRHRLLQSPAYNHRIDYIEGILHPQCTAQLQAFFQTKR